MPATTKPRFGELIVRRWSALGQGNMPQLSMLGVELTGPDEIPLSSPVGTKDRAVFMSIEADAFATGSHQDPLLSIRGYNQKLQPVRLRDTDPDALLGVMRKVLRGQMRVPSVRELFQDWVKHDKPAATVTTPNDDGHPVTVPQELSELDFMARYGHPWTELPQILDHFNRVHDQETAQYGASPFGLDPQMAGGDNGEESWASSHTATATLEAPDHDGYSALRIDEPKPTLQVKRQPSSPTPTTTTPADASSRQTAATNKPNRPLSLFERLMGHDKPNGDWHLN
ncbi:MAG: hypothetical protein KC476_07875 [Cyanobacteria bacterium HKST-UBA06]|nr:hypothetical protein [Cyanobacteria bacterium HKST-UBA06]